MKTVMVFGTFDMIHPGHRWFLKKAAAMGDKLVAVVSRDRFVHEWKGHPPLRSESQRIAALEASGLVDRVVLADRDIRTYGVVHSIRPDVICLGHDQHALKDDLLHWIGREGHELPEIRVLPPWRRYRYSSTLLNRSPGHPVDAGTGRTGPLVALLVIAMATYGFSWVSGKTVSLMAPPAVLALIRFVFTFLCFLPALPSARRDVAVPRSGLTGWLITAAAALAIAAYNLFFFIGLRSGPAGRGGLIVTTMNPLFTVLILQSVRGGKPGRRGVFGITAGIAGGVLLFEPWNLGPGEILVSGNLAFLAAAAAWSILTLLSRPAQRHLGFRVFNAALYGMASLMMLPFALPGLAALVPADLGWEFWGHMIFLGAAVGAFGTGVYFVASSRLGAARGSAFTYLVPVSALGFTALILGETPEPLAIAGGILAIGAVILINRPNQASGKSIPPLSADSSSGSLSS